MRGKDGRSWERSIEGGDEAIFEADPSGRIHYTNPAMQMLLGYQPDELLGANVAILALMIE